MRFMGILLIAAVAWTAIFWSGSLLFGGETQRVATWTADVQFVFTGADRGEYPNGMPFVASDLVSKTVLERVVTAVDSLPDDVDADALGAMLAVAAHFPDADRLRQRYRQRLSSDLSLAEIREVETAFVREFERGARSRARVFLTTGRDDLPVVELLQAIPAAWADYMRAEYGVFRTNRTLYSASAVNADMLSDSDPLMVYLVLREQLKLLQDNVQTLEEEPNSGNVRDPDSGLRLADIEARVRQFDELVMEGRLSDVLEAAVFENPEQARRFLTIRVERQGEQLALLQSKSAAVEQALSDYDVDQFSILDTTPGGVGAGGEDFLNRLIALGIEGGDLGFRQELTRERLEYELESAGAASDQRRLETLLNDLDQALQRPGDEEIDPAVYRQQIAGQLNTLVGSVHALFEVTERLAGRLDALRYGEEGRMVNLGQLSAEPAWTSGRFTEAHWHWYLLSLLAVVLVTLLLMLASQLRSKARLGGSR